MKKQTQFERLHSALMDWRMTYAGIKIYAALVARDYATRGRRKGFVWPSTALLLQETGLARRHFFKALCLLEDLSYIRRTKMQSKNGTWKHNVYELLPNPIPPPQRQKQRHLAVGAHGRILRTASAPGVDERKLHDSDTPWE